jgi:hypothetical protein
MFDCQLLINSVTALWSESVNLNYIIAKLINILISSFADYFVFAEGYCCVMSLCMYCHVNLFIHLCVVHLATLSVARTT